MGTVSAWTVLWELYVSTSNSGRAKPPSKVTNTSVEDRARTPVCTPPRYDAQPPHGSEQPVPTPLRFLGQEPEEQLEWLYQPPRTCGNLQNWGSRPVGCVSPWTTP